MVIYYISGSGDNPVAGFLNSIEKSQKAKVFRLFEMIEKYGISSVPKHIKKLTGTPLWELRVLGRDNIRVIYVAPYKDTILALNAFIKKQDKAPIKELQTAWRRYLDWKRRDLDK